MSQSLLLYDGSKEVFRTVADALADRSETLEPVPWEGESAQQFLEAQFGGKPFAFILIEGESVHVGAETVERVLRDQGVPESVTHGLTCAYPAVSAPLGRVIHGRKPADIEGTFELAEEARPHVRSMGAAGSIPAGGD